MGRDLMITDIVLAIWTGFGKEPISLKHILQIISFGSFGRLPLSLLGTNAKQLYTLDGHFGCKSIIFLL